MRFALKAKAALRLLRPVNALIAGGSVFVGAACMPDQPEWTAVAWGALAMAALSCGGNAENDVIDLKIDRINRPDRPLPQGLLTPAAALGMAYALYALGCFAAWQVGNLHAGLALAMAFLLIVYNRRLKGMPLSGNLTVALLCALALVFPEFPNWPQATGIPAGFAFFSTLARELLKDLEDRPGDGQLGLKTLPLVYGENRTRHWVGAITLVLLLALPLPSILLHWNRWYMLMAMMGPAPLLLGMGLRLQSAHPDYGALQRRYKWIMLTGLIALLGGALWNV
jgi:geranylgeranylglycerol-phosphate geranylgeranyltransferase